MADEYEARSFVCVRCGNHIHIVGYRPEGWPPDVCGTCWVDEPDEPQDNCPGHRWVYTGTAYGGDDPRWHGEGRVYCELCGADGDA